VDPLDRAHAILGVRRGCSQAELKRTYRQLVRRWHPDRFAGDPAGQAAATAQLRDINDAFRMIARAKGGGTAAARPPGPAPPGAVDAEPGPSRDPGRPLSRSEIDALIAALRTRGPIDIALDWAEVLVPFAGAFVLLMPTGHLQRALSPVDAVVGLSLAALGIVLLWRRRARRED